MKECRQCREGAQLSIQYNNDNDNDNNNDNDNDNDNENDTRMQAQLLLLQARSQITPYSDILSKCNIPVQLELMHTCFYTN